jgi:hypothetical protein
MHSKRSEADELRSREMGVAMEMKLGEAFQHFRASATPEEYEAASVEYNALAAAIMKRVEEEGRGHADAHRNPVANWRCPVGKSGGRDHRAYSLSNLHSSRTVGLRQHHGKLFTSVSGNQVTGLMALAVVVELKMIYITDQQRKRLMHPNVPTPLLQQVLVETPPIGDLGDAIDARLFTFLGRIVALLH